MQNINIGKKYVKYLIAVLLGVALSISSISAYFTATDTVENQFNVERVSVVLHEPAWESALDSDGDGTPDVAEDITPCKTINKDPTAQNVGTVDQFVFLKVTVPYREIVTANPNGTKNDAANIELFTWNTATTAGSINAAVGSKSGAINNGWLLVDTYVNEKTKSVEYTYAYATAEGMTALPPQAYTPALFNSVTMCDVVQGQGLEANTLSIKIDVYAIQSSHLGNAETAAPKDVLLTYLNQNAGMGGSNSSHGGTIPKGATYTTGIVWDDYEWCWDDSAAVVYSSGDKFPETPQVGDIYMYGDYEYCYCGFFDPYDGWSLHYEEAQSWGVVARDRAQSVYQPMLSSINNKPVSLMCSTFFGCTNLVEAPEIPNSVVDMYYTYIGCASLTTAPQIPDGVRTLDSVFVSCSELDTYVGSNAEDGDFSNYILPDSVTSIKGIFQNCTSLITAPAIPSNVKNMSNSFSMCDNLVTAPTIPSGVTNMLGTFYGCSSMTTAPSLPSGVESISEVFQNCKSLKTYEGAPAGTADGDFSGYVIPNSVEHISCAFTNCINISVAPKIPNGVTDISSMFNGCTALVVAPEIPTSVISMNFAFNKCTALTTAPDLSGCTNLQKMLYTFQNCTALETYHGSASEVGDFSQYVIPDSVTDMTGAFNGCTKITVLPNG